MIWRYGQYVPVALFTIGAAIVSTSTAWETASRGAWWLPAVGLCLLALAVETLKPIAVARRMWWFAIPCVIVSGLAEFQTVARGRAGYAETKAVETKDLAAGTTADLRDQLAKIQPARTSAELAPLVEATEKAAGDCPAKMGPVQRDACRALPQLKSEAARAIQIESLRKRIEDGGEKRLQVRGESEEAAALTTLLGWLGVKASGANVDQSLALLLIVLFQAASVGSAAVLQVGAHGAKFDLASGANPMATGIPAEPAGGANDPQDAPLLAPPSELELLTTFLRGKGGVYAGSRRGLAETLNWSRRTLDRRLDELVKSGVVEINNSGIRLNERIT